MIYNDDIDDQAIAPAEVQEGILRECADPLSTVDSMSLAMAECIEVYASMNWSLIWETIRKRWSQKSINRMRKLAAEIRRTKR